MDENVNELMSLKEQYEALRQKNDHLEADNKKLRKEIEILEGSHQLQADIMDNNFVYSSEPTEKKVKEISDAMVQTEDFGRLEDGCTAGTTVEVIEGFSQQLKNDQATMKEELESAIQMNARVTERLEIELKTKQALQTEYDLVKADQQKFLLRELRNKQEIDELEDLYRKATEQNEKLRDEMENQKRVTFESKGVVDQTFGSLEESLEEANAKLNKIDQMIATVQKRQELRTFGPFKPLLVVFLVSVIVAFLASLVSISVDPTDPNALYDRRQYI